MYRINRHLAAAMISGASILLAPGAFAAQDGVRIDHLGVNNTLVRVNTDKNFIVLPVQESIDDARINVLVDGKIAETIFVRLANTKTDYSVPFDLSRYKGHDVIFDIVAPHGRRLRQRGCRRSMLGWNIPYRLFRYHRQGEEISSGIPPHPSLRMDERPERYVL